MDAEAEEEKADPNTTDDIGEFDLVENNELPF